jgi:hypothetical protein
LVSEQDEASASMQFERQTMQIAISYHRFSRFFPPVSLASQTLTF